jgi:YfiH family protein
MINDIIFDDDVITLFLHKPYNFKRDSISNDYFNKQLNKVENEIGYKFKYFKNPIQKHTNIVKVLDNNNITDSFDGVDGLITNLKGVAIGTLVADCQSIVFYDPINKVIGNIHSGWKGTLSRISTNAINIMKNYFNSNPEDIKIYIFPSIHKCCFEVDEDLKQKFENEFKEINFNSYIFKGKIKEGKQKYYIDTIEINKQVLINLGVKEKNINSSSICSVCNSEFIHSYRSDKPIDGRNLSIICIK